MVHLSLVFSTSTVEPSFFFKAMLLIWPLGTSTSFGLAGVAAVLDRAASGWRFDHQTAPLRATSSTAATSRLRGFILSPFHKDRNSAENNEKRNCNQIEIEEQIHLALVHVQSPILWRLRSDRDKILVGRQPVDRVQSQVPVPLERKHCIRDETGTANHDKAPGVIRISRIVIAGSAENEGSLLVAWVRRIDFVRIQLCGSDGTVSGRDQFLKRC